MRRVMIIKWLFLLSLFSQSTQHGNGEENDVFLCGAGGISSRYKNHTGPSEQDSGNQQVYPRDRVFEAGSNATFCCILPAGESFLKMYLDGYGDAIRYNKLNYNATRSSDQTYTLTVLMDQPSYDCIDVQCETNRTTYGACTFVGYPPGDRDLQCETRDLKSVECHWTVGTKTYLPAEYHLLGSVCANGSKGWCSQKLQSVIGERNWTLKAQNKLGQVELHDNADVTKRVHMFAPEGVTASTVNARNISLRWSWRLQQYNHLNLTCQVNVSHGGTSTIRENVGVGLNAAAFNDLIPNWTYNVTVRCGTAEHFWRWGDWSESVTVHTQGDVPDALDVWMQMKENQVVILWKMPLANQSHGNIIDYDVTWVNTVNASEHSVALSLDTSEEHVVTVKARNTNGSSSPSTITIPSLGPDQTTVNTSWITGSNGGFNLSWLASPSATCGYVVDWCPTSGSGPVEWLKVPPNDTNAFIFSENFNDGVRYSLSIYACTQKAPVLVERREGYVRETRIEEKLFKPPTFKQQGADAEVSWHAIPLREQSAFIQGYTLYYWNNRGKVFSVSTDDPEATSLKATDLNITSYTFTVTAKTAVGECGNASITATLNSLSDTSIQSVLVSLGVVFGLLSLTTVLCYRHWACIKHKVYPPIPKPELMWVTSQGQFRCRQLDEVQSYPSEASIMDISELHYKYRTPVTNNYSQEEVPFVFSQTPKGLFLNPSYDLTMQTGDQQASSGPEVHEGTTGIRCQPPTETFLLNQPAEDQDTPLVCVSSYILLPQTPST